MNQDGPRPTISETARLAEMIMSAGNFYIRLENEDELLVKSYRINRYADGKVEIVFSHLENFFE